LTVELHNQDAITKATALAEKSISYSCYGDDKTSCLNYIKTAILFSHKVPSVFIKYLRVIYIQF
jgi:hypothetical protein